jgi:hypothetical protein
LIIKILFVIKILVQFLLIILKRKMWINPLIVNMRVMVRLLKYKDIGVLLLIEGVDRWYILSLLCKIILCACISFYICLCNIAIGFYSFFPLLIVVIIQTFIIWTIFLP